LVEFLKALLEIIVKDPKTRTNIIQLALLGILCLGLVFAPPRSNSTQPAKNTTPYEVKGTWVPDSPVSKDPFYKLPDQSQNN
jgi:hypothetical protein